MYTIEHSCQHRINNNAMQEFQGQDQWQQQSQIQISSSL